MKYYCGITENMKAIEELQERCSKAQLSPERYYTLLVLSGVSPEDAETSKASMLMEMMKPK